MVCMADQIASQTQDCPASDGGFLGAREARLYRATFQDGRVDAFAGVIVVLIGVAWLFDLVALGAIAPAVVLPFWAVARRRITEPRLGYSTPLPRRVARERGKAAILVVLGVMVLVLGVGLYFVVRPEPGEGWRHLVPALPSALLGFGAVLCAFVFGVRRFFLHAAAFLVAGAWVAHEQLEPGWGLLVGGCFVLTVGLALLARFVARVPIVEGRADGGL